MMVTCSLLLCKMGRKGSLLVKFLEDGLMCGKYKNLRFQDRSRSIFVLDFPQKTCRLEKENEMIFHEWYKEKGKEYFFSLGYSKAKQNFEASLKKSDYLEKVPDKENKLCYRILRNDEVKAFKKRNKLKKDSAGKCQDSESGYESMESPPSNIQDRSVDKLIRAIEHDHSFGSSTSTVFPVFKEKSEVVQHVTNSELCFFSANDQIPCNHNEIVLTEEHATVLIEDLFTQTEKIDYFPFENIGEVSLQELEKIPENELVMPICGYKNLFKEDDLAGSDCSFFKDKKKKKTVYVFEKCVYFGSTPILFCEQKELLLEMKVDNSDEKIIFFKKEMLPILQNSKGIKDIHFVNENMLIVLEV